MRIYFLILYLNVLDELDHQEDWEQELVDITQEEAEEESRRLLALYISMTKINNYILKR